MQTQLMLTRTLPIGAELVSDGAHFRVWAPRARQVRVKFDAGDPLELEAEADGYFSGVAARLTHPARYHFQLDDDPQCWPDPASRFQPEGPEGASQVIDPHAFEWQDQNWRGARAAGNVLYEMHIGTFTREGSWRAAAEKLSQLADLGVTLLEVMPIAEFPGQFGWSYDGANLFAHSHLYGKPDDARSFVNTAHQLGLGVILDVVYNHLGCVGEELLRPFSHDYFSRKYKNDWGSAINFDDACSEHVREFFVANVVHWIREYHFDGLRIDATQAVFDQSDKPILLELNEAARRAASERTVLLVGESEPQDTLLLRGRGEGGSEFDALWNDDFHHSATVTLTGRGEAYYSDYRGDSNELLAAVRWGFLFQGQRYAWQKHPRGKPAHDLPARAFIHYLQNHDQIANSAAGKRIHELTSPGRLRAMTALLLLAPQTPLLFQGQEFAASSPFLYFNDCSGEKSREVARGRATFLAQFPSLAARQMQKQLPLPSDPNSFRRSQLDWAQRDRNASILALHRDLLRLRRDDPVLAIHDATHMHAAALNASAGLLRYLPPSGETRLLIFNFGRDLVLPSISQPLVAPPLEHRWQVLWSSEDPRYGGGGTPELDTPDGWRIPGEAAFVLAPALLRNDEPP